MRKVLFLDVDGVLNSAEWFEGRKAVGSDGDYLGLRSVNPEAVLLLRDVIDRTGCTIVLSSTWRLVDDYVRTLCSFDIPIADKTPLLSSAHRGDEIAAWLKAHPTVEQFAIVDDDEDAGDGPGLAKRFVRTNWETGLKEEHAEALVALLS